MLQFYNKRRIRTNHITGKLLSSCSSHPPIANPLNRGWELRNGHGKVKWTEGELAPTLVELITADESNVVDYDENGEVCFFCCFFL